MCDHPSGFQARSSPQFLFPGANCPSPPGSSPQTYFKSRATVEPDDSALTFALSLDQRWAQVARRRHNLFFRAKPNELHACRGHLTSDSEPERPPPPTQRRRTLVLFMSAARSLSCRLLSFSEPLTEPSASFAARPGPASRAPATTAGWLGPRRGALRGDRDLYPYTPHVSTRPCDAA